MNEMDWFTMDLPKAEVLIINFSATTYFLPPFIHNMPRLRALIVINHGSHNATLRNLSILSNCTNLRSIWLEKVSITTLSSHSTPTPLHNLRKISLVLCNINNTFDSLLPFTFPSLSELTIDHCDNLNQLPSSISQLHSLKSLSITNCHNFRQLPTNLGDLKRSLHILRLYACPSLKMLPRSICELSRLKFLDVSQCVNLRSLPEGIGKMSGLEKIDMRECSEVFGVPDSAASMESLRCVICDEEVSWSWKGFEKIGLHVQVAEKHFNLDWLNE